MDQSSGHDTLPGNGDARGSENRSHARVTLSAWLCSGAIIAYLCRNSLAVAEKTIRLDLEISEETMGFILGPAFFWSYALFQIPGGLLGKKFGSRLWLPLFSAVSAGATMLLALSGGTVGLMAARIGTGVAQAGQFPCSAIAITKWFPRGERALTSGLLGAAMSVGGAIGAALTGELLEITSWQITMGLYAVPGLIWAIGFRCWFRETPDEHPSANAAEVAWIREETDRRDDDGSDDDESEENSQAGNSDSSPSTSGVSWLLLTTRFPFWLICGQQFFRAAGYAFFSSWFATYLQETRNVSTARSGWLLTLPLIASVLAAVLGGGVSDFVYRQTGRLTLARSGLASVSLLICAGLVFSAWFVRDATVATIIISAGAFCAAVAGPCAYASSMDLGGRNVALVFSWMNMIGNFGAGLLPWVVPRFRTLVDESPLLLSLCRQNSWNAVLILFGSMFLLASTCWGLLQVKENELEL